MVGKTNALSSGYRLIVVGYEGNYDGSAHAVTASVPSAYASSTRIQYSTNNTSWSNTPTSRTNAGTTTVYVRAVNSNFATLTAVTTLTINPAPVTLTAGSGTYVYNGSNRSITSYTSSVSGLYFRGVSASGSGTNVGEYSVTLRGVTLNTTTDSTGNYVVTATVNGKLTITKATASSLGLSVSDYSGSYDGNSHSVSVSVYISSGTTIYYRTSTTGSWVTTAPTRTSKGTTTVYVKAENNNYETATASGTITITDPPKSVIILNWNPDPSRAISIKAPTKGTTVYTYSNTPSGYVRYEVPETGRYVITAVNMTPSNPIIQVTSLYNETYYCEGQL